MRSKRIEAQNLEAIPCISAVLTASVGVVTNRKTMRGRHRGVRRGRLASSAAYLILIVGARFNSIHADSWRIQDSFASAAIAATSWVAGWALQP